MSRQLKALWWLAGSIALTAILIFSGCSNNSPVSSQIPEVSNLTLSSVAPTTVEVSSTIMASTGGTINIAADKYLHSFSVPAGSIPSDTLIDILSKKDLVLGKSAIVFEFGPEGLVFGKAAVLNVDITEINSKASSGKLYYFDPAKSSWVLIASTAVKSGRVSFNIYHFSKYAIGD